MSTTNLELPFLEESQAQKHVTVNECLQKLDIIVQLTVQDAVTTPPGSPSDGQAWIVSATATGAFAGHETHIAARQDGAWFFLTPKKGWLAYHVAAGGYYRFDGAAWTASLGSLTVSTLKIAAATASSATSGGATLPATPQAFATINVNGTNYKIPLYNV